MRTNLKSRRFLVFISIIILCICFGGLGGIYSFWAYPDEFGYWSPAARLSGYDWSQVTSIGSYYSYGYSLILYIIFNIFKNAVTAYRAAIFINFALSIAAVWLIYFFICSVRNIASESKAEGAAAIISAACVMYPAWSLYSQSTMSESLILFLFVLVSFLMYRFLKKPGIINGLLLAACSMYAYLVHMRMIGTVIAIMVTLLVWAFSCGSRKIRMGILIFIAVVAFCFAVSFVIKSHIVSEVYTFSSKDTINWNDYNGQLPKILKLFTPQGMQYMFENISGKVLYISLASYGLGLWGIAAVTSLFIKSIKSLRKRGSKSRALFGIYMFLAVLLQIGVALVYLIDSPSPDNARLDLLLHGRYTDMLIPVLLIYGIYAMYYGKHPVIITGIISAADVLLMIPILIVISRNNTGMSELQGFTMAGVSYMLSYQDTDAKAFLIRAVIFGVILSWVVCFIVLIARRTGESMVLACLIVIQLALSVVTCNKFMYSIQPYVYTDVQLTDKVERLEEADPDRQIIHIFKGGIPYIEVVQFGLRDKVIDVIDAEVEDVFISAFPLDAIIITDADTPLDADLRDKYDTAIYYGHLKLYFNE